MISIDNLIYNTLLTGKRIYLPKVGTLGITHRAAEQPDGEQVVPPSSTLSFSPRKEFGTANVLALIATQDGVEDNEQAKEIYAQWLAGAMRDDSLVIEGVGAISGSAVSTDDDFFSLLNHRQMKNESNEQAQGRNRRWLWPIGIILLLLLIVLLLYFAGLFSCGCHRQATVERVDTAKVAIADTAKKATPTPAPEAPTMAARFYVVAGIFRNEANADARVKSAASEFPGMAPEKVRRPDGMFMVSIFKSDTRLDAQRVVDRFYFTVDNEIWIWENK